jgi:hypothetical protein
MHANQLGFAFRKQLLPEDYTSYMERESLLKVRLVACLNDKKPFRSLLSLQVPDKEID